MATGLPVTRADLISRMDIPQRHAQGIGVNQPILKLSPAGMHRATSQQATIVAPEGCTRPFSQMRVSDKVGRRIHTVLQINLTI